MEDPSFGNRTTKIIVCSFKVPPKPPIAPPNLIFVRRSCDFNTDGQDHVSYSPYFLHNFMNMGSVLNHKSPMFTAKSPLERPILTVAHMIPLSPYIITVSIAFVFNFLVRLILHYWGASLNPKLYVAAHVSEALHKTQASSHRDSRSRWLPWRRGLGFRI